MLPNVLQRSASDHVPVLAEEVRELLAVRPGETVVDATFGAGGHSSLLAADLEGDGKLIAIDRDPSARTYFDRFKAGKTVSRRASCAASSRSCSASSPPTTSRPTRSCSTSASRRCSSTGPSAASRTPPTRRSTCGWTPPPSSRPASSSTRPTSASSALIFRRYGEERYARQIARAIVRRRAERPFERTTDLADTIKQAIPTPARFGDGHPAKRVFQALRIAVNDELGALEAALPAAVRMLRPGGRIAVISFHSLEDRIVKQYFREQARGCTCPPEFPICNCGNEPVLRDLTRKPVRPGAPRARGEPARGVGEAPRGGEGGRLMASWAGTARVETPPVRARRGGGRSRAPRRGRARSAASSGSSSSPVLLAGVVAVNVAVLQLNVRLDELGRERVQLRADTNRLSSQLSSASANARIESQARTRLGLVRADPALTEHVQLAPPKP